MAYLVDGDQLVPPMLKSQKISFSDEIKQSKISIKNCLFYTVYIYIGRFLPAGLSAPAEPPLKPPKPLSAERLASCIEPNFPAC